MNSFDTGNTGFMLVATSLVMLMTPGLAFFYGGLVGRKNVLGDHDPELRLDGCHDHALVDLRLLALLQRRRGGHHRQPGHGLPPRRGTRYAFRRRAHPAPRLHRLSDDVCHHHPGAHHRRFCQPRAFPGVPGLPRRMALPGLLPIRAHDLGRGPLGKVGGARLRGRHRGAQHRRNGGAGLGALRGSAAGRRQRAAQHSAGGAWGRDCSGSAGTASMPAANCGWTQSRGWPS